MDKREALGAVWPKGEEQVADREGDAVTKGNCLFIENPAPFHTIFHTVVLQMPVFVLPPRPSAGLREERECPVGKDCT